jgi:hypothetical protein
MLALVGELGRYWERRGHWREGLTWLFDARDGEKRKPAMSSSGAFWAGIFVYLGEQRGGLTQGLALPPDCAPALGAGPGRADPVGVLSRNRVIIALQNPSGKPGSLPKAGDLWGTCIAPTAYRIHYRRNECDSNLPGPAKPGAGGKSAPVEHRPGARFPGVVAHDHAR